MVFLTAQLIYKKLKIIFFIDHNHGVVQKLSNIMHINSDIDIPYIAYSRW